MIPPSRVHRHRFHSVLAPNARLRTRVIALGRDDADTAEPNEGSPEAPGTEASAHGHGSASGTPAVGNRLLEYAYGLYIRVE
jgi:hypothetical protein